MSADAYTRATANVEALVAMRAALCGVDNALDEMGSIADKMLREARDAVGYVALDKIDALIARETARRDAAEMAMREQAKQEAA